MNKKQILFTPVSKDAFTTVETDLKPGLSDFPPDALTWTIQELCKWNKLTTEEKDKWYRENYPECFAELLAQ